MYMTKTAQQTVVRSISRKREQIATLREELEDLNDYLDLVEARVRDAGKPRLTHAEVKKRYGLKQLCWLRFAALPYAATAGGGLNNQATRKHRHLTFVASFPGRSREMVQFTGAALTVPAKSGSAAYFFRSTKPCGPNSSC